MQRAVHGDDGRTPEASKVVLNETLFNTSPLIQLDPLLDLQIRNPKGRKEGKESPLGVASRTDHIPSFSCLSTLFGSLRPPVSITLSPPIEILPDASVGTLLGLGFHRGG